MDRNEAMLARHSVRQYTDKPLGADVISQLKAEIESCNRESGLHIQLITDEPKAFDCFMAHYGKFEGVRNYIALVGKKGAGLDEKCGYYGERIVLRAQELGLNTCWVAMSYSKTPGVISIEDGEKLTVVIAVGYGKTQGVQHKSKELNSVCDVGENIPEWFTSGVKAALLAPTAMNQQNFYFSYRDGEVRAKAGIGFYTKLDLGIAKYHFELGSGRKIL